MAIATVMLLETRTACEGRVPAVRRGPGRKRPGKVRSATLEITKKRRCGGEGAKITVNASGDLGLKGPKISEN